MAPPKLILNSPLVPVSLVTIKALLLPVTSTSNLAAGFVNPIPTLPSPITVILSAESVKSNSLNEMFK